MPVAKTKVEIDPSEYITNMRRARFWLPRTAQWLRKVSGIVNGAKFNLDTWGTSAPRTVEEAKSCGFEGCALGWAAIEPAHRRAGLRLANVGFNDVVTPVFDGKEGGSAAEAFYGIDYDAAVALFGGPENDWRRGKHLDAEYRNLVRQHDPIAAAERIERFCNDMGIALLED